jgi:3-deoxy-D-manno-octulosonic-acid transferase
MKKIWYLIYNGIIIPILIIGLEIGSLFNPKIKKGIKDRRRLYEDLVLALISLDKKKKLIWFHSSSMGEFEQAKPIIQKLKNQKDINVLATFYSPSGYENSKNYPFADVVSYMPFDTPALAKRFIRTVQPDLAVMMRYDIWPNFIWQLKENKIPCLLVDATMRKDSSRKVFISKSFHKELYRSITKILTVSKTDKENFSDFEIPESQIKSVGDTRFDRVYQKSIVAKQKKLFKENLFNGKKILVAGSSWESDEEVYLPAVQKLMKYEKDLLLFLVPHEPSIQRMEKLENLFAGKVTSIRFSYLYEYKNERIILIDSIGILATLYYYANVAFVGGSFKQGIHNILEPAVYGIPVIFGPKIENSQEAKKLVEFGGAKIIKNKTETYKILRTLFSRKDICEQMGKISYDYVYGNIGATDEILKEIYQYV